MFSQISLHELAKSKRTTECFASHRSDTSAQGTLTYEYHESFSGRQDVMPQILLEHFAIESWSCPDPTKPIRILERKLPLPCAGHSLSRCYVGECRRCASCIASSGNRLGVPLAGSRSRPSTMSKGSDNVECPAASANVYSSGNSLRLFCPTFVRKVRGSSHLDTVAGGKRDRSCVEVLGFSAPSQNLFLPYSQSTLQSRRNPTAPAIRDGDDEYVIMKDR